MAISGLAVPQKHGPLKGRVFLAKGLTFFTELRGRGGLSVKPRRSLGSLRNRINLDERHEIY